MLTKIRIFVATLTGLVEGLRQILVIVNGILSTFPETGQ